MSGLSDVDKPAEIKAGALELAAALNDVMGVLKNPSDVHRKILDEHKAMQATKAEYQELVDKNHKILNDHRISRAAFAAEQKKAQEADEKLDKEFSEREKEIQREKNAIAAREMAANKKDKEQRDMAVILSQREASILKREQEIQERETNHAFNLKKLEADKNQIRAKENRLREAIA